MRRPIQRKFGFVGKTKKRPKLGRPVGPNPRIRHETRDEFAASFPCHVTLPVRRDVPSLRSGPVVREVESSFRKACDRGRSGSSTTRSRTITSICSSKRTGRRRSGEG